jgi:hypothetical protein
MVYVNLASAGSAWFRSAGERATVVLIRILSRPPFLAKTMVKHIPLQMLEKADDKTLDDLGLTRSDLDALVQANTSIARSRSWSHRSKPPCNLTNADYREGMKATESGASVAPMGEHR